jgi:hypothetical protein
MPASRIVVGRYYIGTVLESLRTVAKEMTKPTDKIVPDDGEGFQELLRRLGNIERRYGIPVSRWNIAMLCYLDQQQFYDVWKIIVYASVILFRSGTFIPYSLNINKLLFLEDDIMVDDEQQNLVNWNYQNIDEQIQIHEQNLVHAAISLSVKMMYEEDINNSWYNNNIHAITIGTISDKISIPEMEYELCFKSHWRLFISQELYDDESMMLCCCLL